MENMINGITHKNMGKLISDYDDVKLRKANEVYVCPSFACDLRCPHCTLKNLPFGTEIDLICNTIKVLNSFNNKSLIYDIFGGEPLLLKQEYIDKLFEVICGQRYLVSTNLLNYDKDKHYDLCKNALWINVSWNYIRLSDEQYIIWLDNIRKLQKDDIKVNLMVTLTDDLIRNVTPEDFYQKILEWKPYSMDLDYFIGEDNNNADLIDEWMLKLYELWKTDTKFNMVENMKEALSCNGKYKDCSNHYTIMPNGYLKTGCAYYETDVVKTKCLMCEIFPFCNGGCRLETKCTFPKKLFYLIKDEYEKWNNT